MSPPSSRPQSAAFPTSSSSSSYRHSYCSPRPPHPHHSSSSTTTTSSSPRSSQPHRSASSQAFPCSSASPSPFPSRSDYSRQHTQSLHQASSPPKRPAHHHHTERPSKLNNNNPYDLVDQINRLQDLYHILGLTGYSSQNRHQIKLEDIRRAYISRSRLCHPDKLPHYEPCTAAFQKLSFAYETLSKPITRRVYDLSGQSHFSFASNQHQNNNNNPYHHHPSQSPHRSAPGFKSDFDNNNNSTPNNFNRSPRSASSASFFNNQHQQSNRFNHPSPHHGINPDETLNGVLYSTFCEFMDGDFEMIRVLINALNEGNPGLNLGEEVIVNLESAFKKLRTILISGRKYLKVVRFELIKLYEIQSSLRSLSYFNLLGRVRLSLALARVTLSIPMRIDQAMRDNHNDLELDEQDLDKVEGLDDDGVRQGLEGNQHENQDEDDEGDEDDEEVEDEDEARTFPTSKRNRQHDDQQNNSKKRSNRMKTRRRGILPRKVAGLLQITVAVLERGERATMWVSGQSSSDNDDRINSNSGRNDKSRDSENDLEDQKQDQKPGRERSSSSFGSQSGPKADFNWFDSLEPGKDSKDQQDINQKKEKHKNKNQEGKNDDGFKIERNINSNERLSTFFKNSHATTTANNNNKQSVNLSSSNSPIEKFDNYLNLSKDVNSSSTSSTTTFTSTLDQSNPKSTDHIDPNLIPSSSSSSATPTSPTSSSSSSSSSSFFPNLNPLNSLRSIKMFI